MFGKLGVDALPLYSPIAFGGAMVVVLGGLALVGLITRLGRWRYLWTEWLCSVDHRKIGIMYIVIALVMLVRGFIDALMMRSQQATALNSGGYLSPEHFNQVFSSHGTIMIFFMAMPFLTGLINLVTPQQIGARDVAYPFLNSVSLALTAAGAALVMISLVLGKFSTAGWSGYPPFSEIAYSPGVGVDYWIWSIFIAGLGSTFTGINFVVTILKRRAPGMHLMRMPLFTWTALVTSVLMLFAFPALTVATGLLALDRYVGMHFFTNAAGGNMMNFINLFWTWGHPEVYILILPAFGVYSEVFSTFSQKKLFGYRSLVYSTVAIGVLSYSVWLHHFFIMGATEDVNAFFGLATITIGVPTGVQLYVSIRDRNALRDTTGDPWNARTLEWATDSPPPHYNFAEIPEVHALDELAYRKEGRRLVRDHHVYEPIVMPKDTGAGMVLGALSFAFGFAMVWHIWWMAAAGLLGCIGVVVARSFNDNDHEVLSVEEVRETEEQREVSYV